MTKKIPSRVISSVPLGQCSDLLPMASCPQSKQCKLDYRAWDVEPEQDGASGASCYIGLHGLLKRYRNDSLCGLILDYYA